MFGSDVEHDLDQKTDHPRHYSEYDSPHGVPPYPSVLFDRSDFCWRDYPLDHYKCLLTTTRALKAAILLSTQACRSQFVAIGYQACDFDY
jgi:hypothetical protein